jgi:hypothetical protein
MTLSKLGITVVFAIAAGSACNRSVDIEKVPTGSEVTVTRQDGGVVKGSLQQVQPTTVALKVGNRTRTVERAQIADVQVEEPGVAPKALPPVAKFREYSVSASTPVSVRLLTRVASDTSRVEDKVRGELVDAISVDGVQVAAAGSPVSGVVTGVDDSDKVKGRASVSLKFEELRIGDSVYPISMSYAREAPGTKSSDAKKIGIPAAGGAIIGGILGGKKGAVIGGVVGGGAGTAVVLSTSGKEVVLAPGTVLTLTLGREIEVRLPIK